MVRNVCVRGIGFYFDSSRVLSRGPVELFSAQGGRVRGRPGAQGSGARLAEAERERTGTGGRALGKRGTNIPPVEDPDPLAGAAIATEHQRQIKRKNKYIFFFGGAGINFRNRERHRRARGAKKTDRSYEIVHGFPDPGAPPPGTVQNK